MRRLGNVAWVLCLCWLGCSKANTINIQNRGEGGEHNVSMPEPQAGEPGMDPGGGGAPPIAVEPGCVVGTEGAPVVPLQVVAGQFSTCVRMSNGTVQCWGANNVGQLGTSNLNESASPKRVVIDAKGTPLGGIVDLSLEVGTACAVGCDGVAHCWGNGINGQMGNGEAEPVNIRPKPVPGLTGVTKISAGLSGVCAIHGDDSTVACWGSNFGGFVGNGVDDKGTTCGNSASNCVLSPSEVAGSTVASTAISAGASFACSITGSGALCWGDNSGGQLAVDPAEFPRNYEAGGLTSGPPFVEIAAASSFACGLWPKPAGIYCWGNNAFGQLSTPPSDPDYEWGNHRVKGAFRTLATGQSHACAVLEDGTALCWGKNEFGQLGDGTVDGPDECFGTHCKGPTPVSGLEGITQITAGESRTCAIANDEVYCWGSAMGGLLGVSNATPIACSDGEKDCVAEPTKVVLLQ